MRIFIKDSILLASDLGLTGKPIWRHSVDHNGKVASIEFVLVITDPICLTLCKVSRKL